MDSFNNHITKEDEPAKTANPFAVEPKVADSLADASENVSTGSSEVSLEVKEPEVVEMKSNETISNEESNLVGTADKLRSIESILKHKMDSQQLCHAMKEIKAVLES